ncbi:hypothetical protein M0805_007149 [Coniferiporia weirii]|nr:hypothetical protein M0805_007149 [Coniferiporia weirii]
MIGTTDLSVPAYTIRDANESDLPGILDIVNEQIATSSAIFIDDPVDLADRRAWLHGLRAGGFPLFVAVPVEATDASDEPKPAPSPSVLGFTGYGTFRGRPGYRFSVETTLYVHQCARGTGVGSALMHALLAHARETGNVHVLVASTSGDNIASVRFHEKFGFVQTGVMKEVGYKFGKWQDMIFLQLILPGGPGGAKNDA